MSAASIITGSRPDRSLTNADRFARGLAWFSFGLGVAELVAPGKLARALGLEGKEGLVRAYGGREIAAGVGSLTARPDLGIWSRFAGDLLDLGTLAVGLKDGTREQKRNASIAIAAVAGVTFLDLAVAAALTRQRGSDEATEAGQGNEPARRSESVQEDRSTASAKPELAEA
jgi:hypothetical protein